MSKPNIICIVPVKNESWILKDFIESATLWADYIIIGDNNSSDNSLSIAQQYDFVKIIPLNILFDEDIRRKMLIDEARKIPGKRLIFSIDADEMISANWADSPEWDLMLNARPGTRFIFNWLLIVPEQKKCFSDTKMIVAFVDDGTEYTGSKIHSARIPDTSGELIQLEDIQLLHFCCVDLKRFCSKTRWYKCIEYVEFGKKPWRLITWYHLTGNEIKFPIPSIQVKPSWLKGYEWLEKLQSEIEEDLVKIFWWDEQVLNYFDYYGIEHFRKLNIWDVDWNTKARLLGKKEIYKDPRSLAEVYIHKFVEKYWVELFRNKPLIFKTINKFFNVMLKSFGW